MKKFTALFIAIVMTMMLAIPAFAAEEDAIVSAVCCLGDVDDNGIIDAADARYALRISVALVDEELSENAAKWADVNGDDQVLAEDAREILRASVGLAEQKAHSGDVETVDVAATWLKAGGTQLCPDCGRYLDAADRPAVLAKAVDAANARAEEAGLASLISGDVALYAATADVIVNVDGIWAVEDSFNAAALDGFMTNLGKAIKAYVGDATVTVVNKTVYAGGAYNNAEIKNALFDIGEGFFYKLANLDESLVYGSYAVKVDEEEFTINVKLAGSDENIAKVKSFAGTIADHISASVVDKNLVIDLIAPDALVSFIGDKDLDSKAIGAGLEVVAELPIAEVFGSQEAAINRLCAVLNKLDAVANKVIEKVDATVTTKDGTVVALFSEAGFDTFVEEGGSEFKGFVEGFKGALSDDLLALTVGDFATEEAGVYTVQIDVAVDMSNMGMNTINETIFVNIHIG